MDQSFYLLFALVIEALSITLITYTCWRKHSIDKAYPLTLGVTFAGAFLPISYGAATKVFELPEQNPALIQAGLTFCLLNFITMIALIITGMAIDKRQQRPTGRIQL